MSKPGWCGAIAASVGILLQAHGGFTGNSDTAFLGYLVFLSSFGWGLILVLLGTLPPSFGDGIGFGIFLAMCAGATSGFVSFREACLIWALAFAMWLVAEMTMAYRKARNRRGSN